MLRHVAKHRSVATENVQSVFDVNYALLKEEGIELLIFDVDDTLGGYHDRIPRNVIVFLKDLAQTFRIGVLSNCKPDRKKYLVKTLSGIPAYVSSFSNKPSIKGFTDIVKHYDVASKNTAMVGDRIGMDLWGAHRARIGRRIVVEPYSSRRAGRRAPLYYRAIRKTENYLLRGRKKK